MHARMELADSVCVDLGRLSFKNCPDLPASQLLDVLLKKGKPELSSGTHFLGKDWQWVETLWRIPMEAILARKNAKQIVRLISLVRNRAVAALVPLLECLFLAEAGKDADPSQWKVGILRGEWLREEITHTHSAITGRITCCLCFAQRPQQVCAAE